MAQLPPFKKPSNILALIDTNDGVWEDDVTWVPLVVSAITGTEFNGRAISIAGQLEFDPADKCFSHSNDELAQQDIEPDRYSWGDTMPQFLRLKSPTTFTNCILTTVKLQLVFSG